MSEVTKYPYIAVDDMGSVFKIFGKMDGVCIHNSVHSSFKEGVPLDAPTARHQAANARRLNVACDPTRETIVRDLQHYITGHVAYKHLSVSQAKDVMVEVGAGATRCNDVPPDCVQKVRAEIERVVASNLLKRRNEEIRKDEIRREKFEVAGKNLSVCLTGVAERWNVVDEFARSEYEMAELLREGYNLTQEAAVDVANALDIIADALDEKE